MLVAPTPRVLSPSHTTTMDTTEPHSNTPQVEQDPSSPRFNSSENEDSHKDVKDHRARITKSNKTNKKPSPPFKSIKTHKHQLETQNNQFQRLKSGNQYSDTPRNQDDRDLVDLNVRVTNNDVDHWVMVTDPPQNPQI